MNRLLDFKDPSKKILVFLAVTILSLTCIHKAKAISRVSNATGNFNSPATWLPAGVPTATDLLIIQNNHTILIDNNSLAATITVNAGGKLIWTIGKKLTLKNGFIVNGTVEIIEGDIELQQPGSPFKIGPTGTLLWQPANNTVAGATLFTNGIEDFNPSSNLIINKWYNYTNTPIGSVVTGNFGNLALTTLSNGLLLSGIKIINSNYTKFLGL
ncbi:MAG: hypothetical protein IPP71_00220 [Bacteroidetes bacterium]|nr:hypothetical protein [Bacteroidota bacterium]